MPPSVEPVPKEEPQQHEARDYTFISSGQPREDLTNSLRPSASPLGSVSQQPSRSKFSSPVPVSASMTPPPSSQVLPPVRIARTPSPPAPHLSSPPPTLKMPAPPVPPVGSTQDLPTQAQVANASVDVLRTMVADLSLAVRDARTSAAHYKLQYNMLSMDSAEAANRMGVELAMVHREVEVLQQADERRRAEAVTPAPDANAANATMLHEMTRHCSLLQQENEELRDLLAQTRRAYETRDVQATSLAEENKNLRDRIRKNREHLNGLLQTVGDSPRSAIATPVQGTPRTQHQARPQGQPSQQNTGQRNFNNAFDALLAADKVLSQETTTAPSTPSRRPRQAGKPRMGHTRGTHSLSSLPTTPLRGQVLPPPPFQTPPTARLAAAHEINAAYTAPPGHGRYVSPQRRRASSDSTISEASSDGPPSPSPARRSRSANKSFQNEDDEIPESQASQAASSMLKSQGQSLRSSFTAVNTPKSSGLTQTKLFGRVTKPGASSGKASIGKSVLGSPAKRKRVEEAVGLGIASVDRR